MSVNLTDYAIAIVVLGITAGIGGVILTKMSVNQVESLPVVNVNSESVTSVNGVGDNLATTDWVRSITACMNGTSGYTIQPANYTLTVNPDFGTGTLKAVGTAGGYNGTDWTCNYTAYNVSDPRFALANDAAVGLAEYGNWFKILVIVAVAAVVLGLVFMAFGKASGGDPSSGGFEGAAY